MTRINRSIRKRFLVDCFVSEICIPSFPRTLERIPSFPRKRESSTGFGMAREPFKSTLGSRFRGNDVGRGPVVTALTGLFGSSLAWLLLATFLTVSALAQDKLPNVVVLATGGTIAGAAASDVQAAYTSGQVGVEQLLAAVPQAKKLAVMRGEQISNIGSQDMNDEVWLKLARRINELAAMSNVDGIVITHGTDTIEESAYFLNLVVKSKKPVVLTAAMRPSTALSADGPLNFYNAVAVAANKEASGRGVLVVVNDWIHGASSLTKASTTAVQTFLSPLRGLIGTVAYGQAEFYRGPVGKSTTDSEFSLDGVTALPRVDIIMAHENMDGKLIEAAVAAGAKGIVIAGVGNGNMTQPALDSLAAQAKKGIVCVRSSRVATGLVGRNVEVNDDKLGLVASDSLNPQKARVLLRLALLKQRSLSDMQRLFREY